MYLSVVIFLCICVAFFYQFFLLGLLPLPSDSLVGLYHPFRDSYGSDYPNGIPFKNFLITDPVRQQFPWRFLAIEEMKTFALPLWNPYTFSGTPLLGNIQSAVFYPLNIIFFLLPFDVSWSFLVFLQPVLMGLFLFLYLRHMNASIISSLFAAVALSFSGFSVAWMEWNTVVQTALWLPLILLCIEKISQSKKEKNNFRHQFLWCLVFVFALSSSLLAGHLQTFFYVFVLSSVYLLLRIMLLKHRGKTIFLFAVCYFLFSLLTFIQWYPALEFISFSARNVDRSWTESGWFLPIQHLIQFIAPDYFGNPTTLNYFGVWNYAELVGYIGLIPLAFALYALVIGKRKIIFFFFGVLVISLLLSIENPLSRLPFVLSFPFLSTSQPTRLLFLIDFSLVILAAFGIDFFQKSAKKFLIPLGFLGLCLCCLWIVNGVNPFLLSGVDLAVSTRNLYLPTILFFTICVTYVFVIFVKEKRMMLIGLIVLLMITVFDSFRFAQKFLPFTSNDYLFPQTSALTFLENQKGLFRVISNDPRILPPNTSIMYKIQTVEGYDPLYLRRYGELMVALKRNTPDITPPFGFNRIVTLDNIDRSFMNVLGIKYVLSLHSIENEDFKKVYEEGSTQIYENESVFKRAFSVRRIEYALSKQEAIQRLFQNKDILSDVAVVEGYTDQQTFSSADVEVTSYSANKVVLHVSAQQGNAFVVLMDSFYPTWTALLDTDEEIEIFQTNYNFRGIVVPQGEHVVEFRNTLFTYEN